MPSLTFRRKTKHFETCSKTTKKLTIFLNIRITEYEHNSASLQTDCSSANCIVHCFRQNGCGCSHCCCLETANVNNRLPICTCNRMLQLLLLLLFINSNRLPIYTCSGMFCLKIANSNYQPTASTHLFRNVLSSNTVIVVV